MKRALMWISALCLGVSLVSLWSCRGIREIRIGVVGPLSGNEAEIGQQVLKGVDLAVQHWNDSGGIRGRKISIVSMDDADDPARAKEAADDICKKRPLLVIGHVNSGCSMEAAKVYARHRVIMITPLSTLPALTQSGMDNVFRVCGRDDALGREAAIWVMKHRINESVAVVHDNTKYGRSLAAEFTRNYEFLSGGKVLYDMEIKRGAPDIKGAVKKCLLEKPEVLFFGGIYVEGGELLKALRQAGSGTSFMSGDGCFGRDFILRAGKDIARGAVVVFYRNLSAMPGVKAKDFAAAYKAKYGYIPGPYGALGYEAANVGLTAISKAGIPINARTIGDALHRNTFKTLSGLLRFDVKGDPVGFPYSIWVVEDGAFKEVPS